MRRRHPYLASRHECREERRVRVLLLAAAVWRRVQRFFVGGHELSPYPRLAIGSRLVADISRLEPVPHSARFVSFLSLFSSFSIRSHSPLLLPRQSASGYLLGCSIKTHMRRQSILFLARAGQELSMKARDRQLCRACHFSLDGEHRARLRCTLAMTRRRSRATLQNPQSVLNSGGGARKATYIVLRFLPRSRSCINREYISVAQFDVNCSRAIEEESQLLPENSPSRLDEENEYRRKRA